MDIILDRSNLNLLKTLSNETRIEIINLLGSGDLNITQIANALDLSPSIISRHTKLLEEEEIIETYIDEASQGRQKFCKLNVDQIHIQFPTQLHQSYDRYQIDVPLGTFANYDVVPTCGLASETNYIGRIDNPKYFMDPNRLDTQLLWFQNGFVEYNIINPITKNDQVQLIEISFEAASEFPENNYIWPSDITLTFNNSQVGFFTIPGNPADVRGALTPDWWPDVNSQYGYLQTIRITPNQTVINGDKMSNFRLSNINFDTNFFTIRLSALETSLNNGGLTLFGDKFGNNPQNIQVTFYYVSKS